MAKIIDGVTISGSVPKMIETSDSFIINGQVHDKVSLEPKKLNAIPITSHGGNGVYMSTSAMVNESSHTEMYTDNCVMVDRFEPQYSYTVASQPGGNISVIKFEDNDGKIQKVFETPYNNSASKMSLYSQDTRYIYGLFYYSASHSYMSRIDKKTGSFALCDIGSSYSRITLIKDTPLYIYYAYTRHNDRFAIGRYTKSNGSKTDIFNDNGSNSTDYYTMSSPMKVSENEVICIRCNKTFNPSGVDNLILKKYLIDYTFDKVYVKTIDMDCSLLSKGMILSTNNGTHWNQCFSFEHNETNYFSLWNRYHKKLYLFKKVSENRYSAIQEYELSHSYSGVMPYNDGKTLIFFNSTFIDFISFRANEERYELTSSMPGSFKNVCIDKNKQIWLQHADNSVDMIGVNIPTIAESLFADMELDYVNKDIESNLEVFAKNYDGELVEARVEVILSGPAHFSDSGLKRKAIRTSKNSISRVPITITNSGFVEANTVIL